MVYMPKRVMKNRFLDCISLYCPVPVLKTREALDKMEAGEVLELVADDPAAESDIQYLVKITGQEMLKMEKEGQVFRFLIKKVK